MSTGLDKTVLWIKMGNVVLEAGNAMSDLDG